MVEKLVEMVDTAFQTPKTTLKWFSGLSLVVFYKETLLEHQNTFATPFGGDSGNIGLVF